MPLELLLKDARQIALESYTERPVAAGEICARAVLSAISHGTEISLYRGISPFHDRQFDPKLRLFVQRTEQPCYPTRLGYEWVGEVTDVGSEIQGYRVGDLVHLPLPHRQTQIFTPTDYVHLGVTGPLSEGIVPEQAAFLTSTAIALQAVHDAQIKVGDHVVVFGLGILGLLTIQLARRNGAQWIDAVDPVAKRREIATALGADRTFDPLETDIGLALKTTGPGADATIEFSGNYAALHQAIRSVRMGGLVVAAGFYQGGGEALRLGEEWHHNRVTMVASIQGWGNAHRAHPLWDRPRLRAAAITLIKSGQLTLEQFITHRIPFTQAQEAYQIIDQGPPDVLKVIMVY